MAAEVTFTIDPSANNHLISRYIYGINPSGNRMSGGLNAPRYRDLRLTVARLGGNRWTAYNWKNNASNAGSDYRYQNDNYLDRSTSPGDAVMGLSNEPGGDNATIITIPINGYVAADESGPVPPNVPPERSRHFVPEFPSASDDPHPAANHVYQDEFVEWLGKNFTGNLQSGGGCPLFFMLDNEPDLWPSTHPEVHPARPTYAEIVDRSIAYAKAIKHVAPGAWVFGPASYGWNGFVSFQNAPDAVANNAAINPATARAYGDFLSFYLAEMNEAEKSAGKRLLDALDVHWYPEAMGRNASGVMTRIDANDASPGVAAARMNAPRSLWDKTYVENSWITRNSTHGQAIALLPRLLGEIAENYPDTKLSISEYNYGGGSDISGGIAEADVLGLFGKYNVYAAAEWPSSKNEKFILGAIRMFRNFGGDAVGDTSVSAVTNDPANTSIYASMDSIQVGLLRLIAINRTMIPITADIKITAELGNPDFSVYQLTSDSIATADGSSIVPTHVGEMPNAELAHYVLPAQSVSLLRMFVKQ